MPALSLPLAGEEREVPLYTGDDRQMREDMLACSRKGVAELITGGLSRPGKMPCYAWGISATRCRMGSILGQKEGNVCHPDVCYAKKRNYTRDSVQAKLEERYQGLFHPLWTPALASLIHRHCEKYFRLFDSGDLQGANMLKNVVRIARAVPDVIIWMPTRETATLRSVLREIGEFPTNFVPRVSSPQVNGKPLKGFAYTSNVVTAGASCIAQLQGNKCDGELGKCRACWEDEHVSYPLH